MSRQIVFLHKLARYLKAFFSLVKYLKEFFTFHMAWTAGALLGAGGDGGFHRWLLLD